MPEEVESSYKSDALASLPQFPGEDVLAHAGSQWLEQAEARLTKAGLLTVAQGNDPNATAAIIDVDLSSLPPLPHDHRDFSRREETRIKIANQNASNAARGWLQSNCTSKAEVLLPC